MYTGANGHFTPGQSIVRGAGSMVEPSNPTRYKPPIL